MREQMACKYCDNNIWKEKLGRCKRCMWINLILLLLSALLSYFLFQQQAKSVQTIAALFALFSSALLMASHVVMFIYYRFIKADKHTLK